MTPTCPLGSGMMADKKKAGKGKGTMEAQGEAERALLHWENSSHGEKQSVFLPRVEHMIEHYTQINGGLGAEILVKAVGYAKEHHMWRFWDCSFCYENMTPDTKSFIDHIQTEHIKGIQPLSEEYFTNFFNERKLNEQVLINVSASGDALYLPFPREDEEAYGIFDPIVDDCDGSVAAHGVSFMSWLLGTDSRIETILQGWEDQKTKKLAAIHQCALKQLPHVLALTSVNDYQWIVRPLLKLFMKERLMDLLSRKADAAQDALLAEIELDSGKNLSKRCDQMKDTKGKLNNKKKKKGSKKPKDSQATEVEQKFKLQEAGAEQSDYGHHPNPLTCVSVLSFEEKERQQESPLENQRQQGSEATQDLLMERREKGDATRPEEVRASAPVDELEELKATSSLTCDRTETTCSDGQVHEDMLRAAGKFSGTELRYGGEIIGSSNQSWVCLEEEERMLESYMENQRQVESEAKQKVSAAQREKEDATTPEDVMAASSQLSKRKFESSDSVSSSEEFIKRSSSSSNGRSPTSQSESSLSNPQSSRPLPRRDNLGEVKGKAEKKEDPQPWFTADKRRNKMSKREVEVFLKEFTLPRGYTAQVPELQESTNYKTKEKTCVYEGQSSQMFSRFEMVGEVAAQTKKKNRDVFAKAEESAKHVQDLLDEKKKLVSKISNFEKRCEKAKKEEAEAREKGIQDYIVGNVGDEWLKKCTEDGLKIYELGFQKAIEITNTVMRRRRALTAGAIMSASAIGSCTAIPENEDIGQLINLFKVFGFLGPISLSGIYASRGSLLFSWEEDSGGG
ncbi:hypothetical protein RJ639_016114 [Escallonia herrerae]|uniref:DUF629 domain-containing protein n=1 Tax=Escallonia herrerae TaxID=1293975 RepID=A0AA88VB30_9ASTE|nr:hypothetical protein RJ639_016114 [Escallonia herrerae]